MREIGAGGPMLGIYSHASWPEHVVRVGRDETVVLYTDGVTDTRGETGRFGQEQLTELLTEHADLSPRELLAELESALERFQLGPQSDDTAALALRIEGHPASGRTRSRFSERRGPPSSGGPQPSFSLETAIRGGAVAIEVGGEIDHATAARLAEAFEGATDGSGSRLVLDLGRRASA